MKIAELKTEKEAFIMAAQNKTLLIKNYQANIIKNGANPICRGFEQHVQIIDQLVSGLSILTPKE